MRFFLLSKTGERQKKKTLSSWKQIMNNSTEKIPMNLLLLPSPIFYRLTWPLSGLLWAAANDNFIRIVKSMSPHNYHWHQPAFPLIPNPPSQIKKKMSSGCPFTSQPYKISHNIYGRLSALNYLSLIFTVCLFSSVYIVPGIIFSTNPKFLSSLNPA